MKTILTKILLKYFNGINGISIEEELHKTSWHKDLHYKVRINGRLFAARFLPNDRSPNQEFGKLTNDDLLEQLNFCLFLNMHEVPFMKLRTTVEGELFTIVEIEHIIYRFVLFDWIEGHHITSYVGTSAEKFGRAAREFHEIASQYTSDIFRKRSHTVGYNSFYDQLNKKLLNVELSIHDSPQMKHYLEICKFHLENTSTRELDFIVQSDLNPLNVLWDDEESVKGFVDFESIGYTDRIEGLAWLIKWYSRTNGIHSRKMSSEVAAAFLKGYEIDRDILRSEKVRLSSLLWLSGCLNWNFVKRTIQILENQPELLNDHLTWYRERGDSLTDLLHFV